MAALTNPDRADLTADLQRGAGLGGVGACVKADLRAAVNAVDAWIDANAAAFNAAIPQPARVALTAAQKAKLLAAVALKRFEKGA